MVYRYRPKHLDIPYVPYREPEGALSDERAAALQDILRRRYGREFTLSQAREVGERLMRLYRAILGA